MQNRIFVIGDVHGCYHTLLKLVDKLPTDAKLIFAGDLCDKGNFSKDVFEYVINNNHTCIYGNHEDLYLKHIKDAVFENRHSIWSQNRAFGGAATIASYGDDLGLIDKHLSWIKTLPKYLEIEKYFITHGFGLPYYQRKDILEHQKKLYVNRIDMDEFTHDWEDYANYDVINIFGHCKFDDVLIGDNYFGIDTACAYGNKLTAIELKTHKIYTQATLDIDLEDNYLLFFTNEEKQLILDKNHPKYQKTFKAINRLNEYVAKKYDIVLFSQWQNRDELVVKNTKNSLGIDYIVKTLNTKELLNLNKQIDDTIAKYMSIIYDGEGVIVL